MDSWKCNNREAIKKIKQIFYFKFKLPHKAEITFACSSNNSSSVTFKTSAIILNSMSVINLAPDSIRWITFLSTSKPSSYSISANWRCKVLYLKFLHNLSIFWFAILFLLFSARSLYISYHLLEIRLMSLTWLYIKVIS